MFPVCAYGDVVGYFWCFILLCESCFLYCDYFVSDSVSVDLKYDNVFVLWLIFVCEWVDGVLSVMGCCVGCAWRCYYELCGCVHGASPVRFVLSFYLCAFQINLVCVVTSDWSEYG